MAPLLIGLTGGIGSGKSTAAARFAALGVEVIDADVIARELVEPGSPVLEEIVQAFGADVLGEDGRLDRDALGRRAFADPQLRRRLEDLLHPRIRRLMAERARQAPGPYCVLVIPLLVETGQRNLVDRVLVVDAPEALQIERTLARDRSRTEEQVRALLAAQVSREARLAAADDVLVNDADLESLQRRVDALDARYREKPGSENNFS